MAKPLVTVFPATVGNESVVLPNAGLVFVFNVEIAPVTVPSPIADKSVFNRKEKT